jgi:hypothetical protein
MGESKVVRTFKLEKGTLSMLRQAAQRQGVSPNALAGRILSESLEGELFSKPFGWIAVGRRAFQQFLLSIDPEDLAKAGLEQGKKDFDLARETSESYGRELTLRRFVVEVLGRQCGWFVVEGADVRPERVILRHELGANWSAFLKSYLQGASDATTVAKVSVETFEGFVSVSFV